MKISFCTIAFQKNKWGKERIAEMPIATILPILGAGGAGYDGAELWYPHVEGGDLAAIRGQLAAAKLAVPMLSSYYDFTTSDETSAASLAHAHQVIADAVAIGATSIRIFTGRTGSAAATPEHWDRGVRALQTVADAAARHGLRLACETHPQNLMDTVASSLELLRRVARKNVGLILQPQAFAGEYVAACEALAPHAFHIHATAGVGGKTHGLAEDAVDYRKVVAILRKHGFDGSISVEWMGPEPEATARREAAYLRSLL